MAQLMIDHSVTLDELAATLAAGRDKYRRKIGHNTWLKRFDGGYRVIYHETAIVTYHDNGDITLANGGWFTPTTKDRIHDLTPARVSQVKGRWYVDYHGETYGWAEGMTLHPDGTVSGYADADKMAKQDRINNTKRRHITKFVDSITPERIVYQWEHPGGDCLLCRTGQTSCLLDHVEDNYFHAHLGLNAFKAKRYANPEILMGVVYQRAQRGHVDRLLTDALKSYLKKHILEGVATR